MIRITCHSKDSDLPYSLDQKNKFVYRLERHGQRMELSEIQYPTIITYSNLSYGNYQLYHQRSWRETGNHPTVLIF